MQLINLTNRKGSRSFQRGCCISLRSPADCLFLYKDGGKCWDFRRMSRLNFLVMIMKAFVVMLQ